MWLVEDTHLITQFKVGSFFGQLFYTVLNEAMLTKNMDSLTQGTIEQWFNWVGGEAPLPPQGCPFRALILTNAPDRLTPCYSSSLQSGLLPIL